MKKSILVTLVDNNYLDYAKQVLAGAYFNGGWSGDMMVMVYHDVPDCQLEWFRERSILVKKCSPLVDESRYGRWATITLCKFYLFTPEFKKWNKVVFVDVDTIIRGPISGVLSVRGFAAVPNFITIEKTFPVDALENHKVRLYLQSMCNPKDLTFNSGFMVFDSNFVGKNTMDELMGIFHNIGHLSSVPDQIVLNLYFAGRYEKLPYAYNMYLRDLTLWLVRLKIVQVKGVVLHFLGTSLKQVNKPWNKRNVFYDIWKNNLDKADDIKIGLAVEATHDPRDIVVAGDYLETLYKLRFINFWFIWVVVKPLLFFDRSVGKCGFFLKSRLPSIYYGIKRMTHYNDL